MQANKDQDWTDDAAFWDEAWKDMNTRLDAKPARRKGGLAWWFLYLGIGASFLFALVMGAGILFNQDQVETIPPPPSVIAKAPASEGIGTDETKMVAVDAAGASITDDQEGLANTPQAVKREVVTPQLLDQTNSNIPVRQVKTVNDQKTSPTTKLEHITVTEETVEWEEGFPAGKAEETSRIKTAIANDNIPDEQVKKAVSPRIASLTISELVANTVYSLSTVPLQRRSYPNPLTFEVGLNNSLHLKNTGFLTGINYRIKSSKKLSFPLSLRYRVESLEVIDSPREEADQNEVVVTNDSTSGVSTQILLPYSISTSAVELKAGLALEVTPRLRLNTGLSAAYMLQALVNFEGHSSTADFTNTASGLGSRQLYSVNFDRGEELLSAQSEDGASPNFSRWAFRANLGATYDITPRLGVNLNVTRLLRQPDRAKVIGLQTGQIEFGLSYRLR